MQAPAQLSDTSMPQVLIVEDDVCVITPLHDWLSEEGCTCTKVGLLKQAVVQLSLQRTDWIFASQDLPDGCGIDLIDVLNGGDATRLVIIAARPDVDKAVHAFRRGAVDYLIAPPDRRHITNLIRSRRCSVRSEPLQSSSMTELLGVSPVMQTLREHITRVAPTEASVLLLGESGTGKELVAQNIHAQSKRQCHPFLPVNCGAISPQLIESEIFGHEKGSFTGADRQHKGYFERSSGGTLFLDEVIEMPIELQVKLLRVLETGSFMRIGSNQELHTDVRIVAATNRDPETAIAEGKLRLDLFHRLNVFPLKIPSLRERGADIELLAHHFLNEFNTAYGSEKRLSARTLSALGSYQWPGNVRELRNFIQRAYILSDQLIDTITLALGPAQCTATALTLAVPVGSSLADVDRQLIFATLDLCGGVKKRAAELLGISLKTLYNRLEGYNHEQRLYMLAPSVQAERHLSLTRRERGLLN
jgi:two-component system response regulator AtoC